MNLYVIHNSKYKQITIGFGPSGKRFFDGSV